VNEMLLKASSLVSEVMRLENASAADVQHQVRREGQMDGWMDRWMDGWSHGAMEEEEEG
jgi:hypothetical protein